MAYSEIGGETAMHPMESSIGLSALSRYLLAGCLTALIAGCSDSGSSGGGGGGSGGGGGLQLPQVNNPLPGGGDGGGSGSYTVKAVAGTGGSIYPEGESTVKHGGELELEITVDESFSFGSVSGCGNGTLVKDDNELDVYTYTTGEIAGDCTVTAYFLAPVRLAAGDGKVTVYWEGGANESGHYNIFYATQPEINTEEPFLSGNGGGFEQVLDAPYIFNELVNGITHWFLVADQDNVPVSEVLPSTPGVLNDTGITDVFDNGHGQDAYFGRDASAMAGTLHKTGAGAAGFDFTKIDESGNDLPEYEDEWSCVRDNHTGLMWEEKVDDSNHLRHKGHAYTWDELESFVTEVKESGGLCGESDGWRMPTVTELLSIVHNGMISGPVIDGKFFPNSVDSRYWSSISGAEDPENVAWAVDFSVGASFGYYNKNEKYKFKARLVRSGIDPVESDDVCSNMDGSSYKDNKNGTVTHLETGLTWMRCSLGQQWDEGICVDTDGAKQLFSWNEALEATVSLNKSGGFSGASNWRLPSKNELDSIVERTCWSPAINKEAFPNVNVNRDSGRFWSSSPAVGIPNSAWKVRFKNGDVTVHDKDGQPSQVRLVRTGDEPAPKAP